VRRLYLASDLGERDARRTAAETAALRNRSDPLGFYFLSRWLFLFLFLFVRDASLLLLIDPCFRNPNGERSHACDHSNTLRYRNCAARIQNVERSEEHTPELQSLACPVCRLLLEKKTGS